jgi:hypothetical protein
MMDFIPDKKNSTYKWFIDNLDKSIPGYSKHVNGKENTDKLMLIEEKIEMLINKHYIPNDKLIAITFNYNRLEGKRRLFTLYNHDFELAPEEKDNYQLNVLLKSIYKNYITEKKKPNSLKSNNRDSRHPLRLNEFRFQTLEELDNFCQSMLSLFTKGEVTSFRHKYLEKYGDRMKENDTQVRVDIQNELTKKINKNR